MGVNLGFEVEKLLKMLLALSSASRGLGKT